MFGVSAYGMTIRAQTPVTQQSQRVFLLGVSGLFAAAGIALVAWPYINPPDHDNQHPTKTNSKSAGIS